MNLTGYPITATDESIRAKEQTCFLVDTTISDTEPIYIVPPHLLIDVKQFQEAVVVIIRFVDRSSIVQKATSPLLTRELMISTTGMSIANTLKHQVFYFQKPKIQMLALLVIYANKHELLRSSNCLLLANRWFQVCTYCSVSIYRKDKESRNGARYWEYRCVQIEIL